MTKDKLKLLVCKLIDGGHIVGIIADHPKNDDKGIVIIPHRNGYKQIVCCDTCMEFERVYNCFENNYG